MFVDTLHFHNILGGGIAGQNRVYIQTIQAVAGYDDADIVMSETRPVLLACGMEGGTVPPCKLCIPLQKMDKYPVMKGKCKV
jgi:hypothetical protein